MSSHVTPSNDATNIESLNREQLICRLRELEAKASDDHDHSDADIHAKNFHDLQVHKIELEMQNRHMSETQLLLEDSRNSYADLYEHCPASLATVSASGRIIRVNSTTSNALGQNKASLLGHLFVSFVAPEDRRLFNHALRKSLYTHHVGKVEVEATVQGVSGLLRMHLTLRKYHDPDTKLPAVAISMADVSSQFILNERVAFIASVGEQFCKNLELDSAASTILNMAVPHLADFAAITFFGENLINSGARQNNTITSDKTVWSAADAEQIYSTLLQSELSCASSKMRRICEWSPSVDDGCLSRDERDVLAAYKVGRVQAWPLGRRGDLLAVLWLVWSNDKNPQILAAPSVLHDFVHRAALSLDNVSLYRLAQSQIKSRSEFLAIVAHDLRNPLTVISMRAERMLQANKLGNAQFAQKSAQAIGHCANRMASLVRDLLDSTSMDSRRLSMTPRATTIGDVIKEDLMAHRSLVTGKGLSIIEDIEGDTSVYCDPRRTNQVIGNLIANAVKFTEPGGQIVLRIKALAETVQISVEDTGCGIDEASHDKVFDPFWQAQQGSSNSHGAGLGLNICKKIVTASNGAIWFTSKAGRGSSFHFTLPRKDQKVLAPQRLSGDAATILIVDDDAAYRETMAEFLSEQGYKVSCAENGQKAIDWISDHGAPSLILLDLQMPVMDGLSFLRIRAANDSLNTIPVTVLSAAADELNVSALAKTQVLWKMTPMQDVLRAIATVQIA